MNTTRTPDQPTDEQDGLTADERAVFERLAERHGDDDVGEIARTVLQSSSPREEAN